MVEYAHELLIPSQNSKQATSKVDRREPFFRELPAPQNVQKVQKVKREYLQKSWVSDVRDWEKTAGCPVRCALALRPESSLNMVEENVCGGWKCQKCQYMRSSAPQALRVRCSSTMIRVTVSSYSNPFSRGLEHQPDMSLLYSDRQQLC